MTKIDVIAPEHHSCLTPGTCQLELSQHFGGACQFTFSCFLGVLFTRWRYLTTLEPPKMIQHQYPVQVFLRLAPQTCNCCEFASAVVQKHVEPAFVQAYQFGQLFL